MSVRHATVSECVRLTTETRVATETQHHLHSGRFRYRQIAVLIRIELRFRFVKINSFFPPRLQPTSHRRLFGFFFAPLSPQKWRGILRDHMLRFTVSKKQFFIVNTRRYYNTFFLNLKSFLHIVFPVWFLFL